MKLGTLINSRSALMTLSLNPLPLKIGWELKLFIKQVNPELTSFDELKLEKIKELGSEIKSDFFQVKKENEQEFYKWLNDIYEKEIEIKIEPIKFPDIINFEDKNGNGIILSTDNLLALDWLIIQ
jgi:hypothetical protein